jgi:hypothetical protein
MVGRVGFGHFQSPRYLIDKLLNRHPPDDGMTEAEAIALG